MLYKHIKLFSFFYCVKERILIGTNHFLLSLAVQLSLLKALCGVVSSFLLHTSRMKMVMTINQAPALVLYLVGLHFMHQIFIRLSVDFNAFVVFYSQSFSLIRHNAFYTN